MEGFRIAKRCRKLADPVSEYPSTWALAFRRDVVLRALKFAMVVGTILVLINHWELLLGERPTLRRAISIALTYCVPYTVITLASIQAIRGERRA